MYIGDCGYGEEDCPPDFRFASDRENPNYAYHYAKYLEKEANERASYSSCANSNNTYTEQKEKSSIKEINYISVICSTDKAVCVAIDSFHKMWIPKSQIVETKGYTIYVTDYFYRVKKLIKI